MNKPRLKATPDREAAHSFLAAQQINPLEVVEAVHFSDGSMSVVMQRDSDRWHLGIEFSPDLTAEVALALRAVGVPVETSDG